MKTNRFVKIALVATVSAGAILASGLLLHAQESTAAAPVPPAKSIWSGISSETQVMRGALAYHQVCVGCHGEALEGDGEDGVPGLMGNRFMTEWDKHTLADLDKHIHAQPNDEPGDVDPQSAVDLVAYILAYNRVPITGTALPPDLQSLSQIGITAYPPVSQPEPK